MSKPQHPHSALLMAVLNGHICTYTLVSPSHSTLLPPRPLSSPLPPPFPVPPSPFPVPRSPFPLNKQPTLSQSHTPSLVYTSFFNISTTSSLLSPTAIIALPASLSASPSLGSSERKAPPKGTRPASARGRTFSRCSLGVGEGVRSCSCICGFHAGMQSWRLWLGSSRGGDCKGPELFQVQLDLYSRPDLHPLLERALFIGEYD